MTAILIPPRSNVAEALKTSSFHSVSRNRARKPGALLLIDELQGRALTAQEWQSLVEGTRGQGLETVRIAHVKPMGLQSVEHCEIYAKEIGLDARVFDSETNARLWLRYGTE